MLYLEPSTRRGRKLELKWWRLGSFPRPPLRPYTRDSSGHLQVLSARGALHLPIGLPQISD